MNKKFLSALTIAMLSTPVLSGTVNADDTTHEKNSMATLNITLDDSANALALNAVPSFEFNDIHASVVMNGESTGEVSQASVTNNTLSIIDNRATTAGWTLSLSATTLISPGSVSLSDTILQPTFEHDLTAFPTINLGGNSTSFTNDQGGHLNEKVQTANLSFGSNSTVDFKANTTFISDVTWTLAPKTDSPGGL